MGKRPDLAERNRKNATHGMYQTSTYTVWRGILRRCNNPKNKDYPRYGGRGIKICKAWLKFENFLSDVGVRPEGMQLDRIKNEGNYERENVRWTTPAKNSNNRRTNVLVEFKGETKTVAEWAREMQVCPKALRYRLKNGWSTDQAFSIPMDKKNRINHP